MNQKNSTRISFLLLLIIPFGAITQFVLCYNIIKFNNIMVHQIINDKISKNEDSLDFIEY